MKYLVTIWWAGEEQAQIDFEVSEKEGVLFGHLVDLEADIAEGIIKAFKVEILK